MKKPRKCGAALQVRATHYGSYSVRMILILLVSLLFTGSCSDSPQRPNILFIMADDHAVRAISAYGGSLIETPNIDRIAAEGALFRNAFVTNSICSPSRAVLLTGKFSHLNGVTDNGQVFDGSQPTFPRMLQEAGYETSVIGKWHLKSDPLGFGEWQVLIGQGEYYSPRFSTPRGVVQYDGDYVTDKITDIAIETLQNRDKSKPFMMLYHHKAPHRNWMPRADDLDLAIVEDYPLPADFADTFAGRPAAKEADMLIADMFLSFDMKMQPGEYESETGTGGARGIDAGREQAISAWVSDYARLTSDQKLRWDAFYSAVNAKYQTIKDNPEALSEWKYQRYLHDYHATVKVLDENVGRILDYLDENGLRENTIVVYTSDQGFYLGEHGWYDKRFMYEPSMRTPLLLRYPASVKDGLEVTELVQNIDFAPTLLSFAGVSVPDDMQGLSLLPWLRERPTAVLRDSVYYRYYGTEGGWHRVRPHSGIRTKRYKLISFAGESEHWELYDLQTDTREQKNLYGLAEFAKVQEDLHAKLAILKQHYGDE